MHKFSGTCVIPQSLQFSFYHPGDLFPALDVPRKRDLDFEKMIKLAALDLKLQPEDGFILKVYVIRLYARLE